MAVQSRSTEPTQRKQFEISAGRKSTVVRGRQAAVSRAKELSATGRPVHVTRADGRMEMSFRGGSLERYRFVTRDRIRR